MAQVNFYAAAKAAIGASRLEIKAENLGEALQNLKDQNSKLAKLLPTCTYLLNGESCSDLNQTLSDQDNLDVLPQFAGG